MLCSCGISEKEYNKVVHERDLLLQVEFVFLYINTLRNEKI